MKTLWEQTLIAIALTWTTAARADVKRVSIPDTSEWSRPRVVLRAGRKGTWDARLYGQISPCTVLAKDGLLHLYYVGADGDRSTDGGPRHRALGLATSKDGLHFQKCSANPVLTHLPHKNQEEGIGCAGGMLDTNGDILIYYGAIWAANPDTEEVRGHIALAKSRDGKNFVDLGYLLSWNDSSVWGHGDEIGPIGACRIEGTYYVYYIAKGHVGAWKLGVASGPHKDALVKTRPLLTEGQYIGGCDPVFIGRDRIAFFIVQDFARNVIEVRTADADTPYQLSRPVKTYSMFKPRYRHTTVYLDRRRGLWFMYQATDRPEDGNKIIVRTARIRYTGKSAGQ